MLDCGFTLAGRNRYDIHPTKSYVLTYPIGHKCMAKYSYTMGEDQVQPTTQTKHLGINRETSQKININEKVNLDRRTAYSLMGAGFHSMNGLNSVSLESCGRHMSFKDCSMDWRC